MRLFDGHRQEVWEGHLCPVLVSSTSVVFSIHCFVSACHAVLPCLTSGDYKFCSRRKHRNSVQITLNFILKFNLLFGLISKTSQTETSVVHGHCTAQNHKLKKRIFLLR